MKIFVVSMTFVMVLASSLAARADNTLSAESALSKGQSLTSKNGFFHLIMQDDGNLVLYFGLPGTSGWASRWSSDTRNSGWYSWMQADGNFVVISNGSWVWQAGSGGHAWNMSYKLTLGDDGELAVRLDAANGAPETATIYVDSTNWGTSQSVAYPMHTGSPPFCFTSQTPPMPNGLLAKGYAIDHGQILGDCSVNNFGY